LPQIRTECSGDFDSIDGLLRAAFGGGSQTRLVDRLRASEKITLALVAEEGQRILGHAVFSRVVVGAGAGAVSSLALAPLAVLPAFQRLGIGSALVSEGLERCRSQGHKGVLVLGDPLYYARFGFVPASRFGLDCPFPAPLNTFMAIELEAGAFSDISGPACYGPEFYDLE
jgi:putative acetyltransferase